MINLNNNKDEGVDKIIDKLNPLMICEAEENYKDVQTHLIQRSIFNLVAIK